MKSSTKRSLIILLAIFLLIGSVVVYTNFVKPAYEEIFSLKSKKAGLETTLNNYKNLNDRFKNLLNQYQDLGDVENQISMIFPSKVDIAYAISQITGIAKLSNLEVQSLTVKEAAIRPASEILAKDLGTLKIDVKMSGDYENFKLFLKRIETNVMLSNLSSFKIENQQVDKNLIYAAIIDAYYQAE